MKADGKKWPTFLFDIRAIASKSEDVAFLFGFCLLPNVLNPRLTKDLFES